MKFTSEFNWYMSYIDTDMLWLEDSINWDDVFELSTTEYNLLSVLIVATFLNTHHLLDWCVKLAFSDLVLLADTTTWLSLRSFFVTFLYDDTTTFMALMLQLPHLFYADFQDLIVTMLYYSPDLVFSLHYMIVEYWLSGAMLAAPALVFDSYQDVTSGSNAEFTEYMIAFIPFVVYVLLLLTSTRITTLFTTNDSYATRAYFYLYSLSNEVRFQLEA